MSSYSTSTAAAANGSSKKISTFSMENFAFRDSRELHRANLAGRAAPGGDVLTGTRHDSVSRAATIGSSDLISGPPTEMTSEDKLMSSTGAAPIGSRNNASDSSTEKTNARSNEAITSVAAAADSTNFGSSLLRVSARSNGAAAPTGGPINTVEVSDDCPSPWRHELRHKNSISLPRSRAIRAEVAGHSAKPETLRCKVKALAGKATAAINVAAGSCSNFLRPPPKSVSIRDLEIKVVRNTRRRMTATDYAVWESGPSRIEWIQQQAVAEGKTPEAWARQEGLRYI